MTSYPRITEGLGELTPALWDRLMSALEFVERQSDLLQLKRPDRKGAKPAAAASTFRPWIILGATELVTDRRWEYDYIGGIVTGSNVIVDPDAPSSLQPEFLSGINLNEVNNGSAEVSYGVPVELDLGGSTADVMPAEIPVGSVVFGALYRDEDDASGSERLIFTAPNPLLPTCQAPDP